MPYLYNIEIILDDGQAGGRTIRILRPELGLSRMPDGMLILPAEFTAVATDL